MTTCGSFIDDRCTPVAWPSANSHSPNNEPRDGHWSVSSRIGSWIDDCTAPGQVTNANNKIRDHMKSSSRPVNTASPKYVSSTKPSLSFDGMDLKRLALAIDNAKGSALPGDAPKSKKEAKQQKEKTKHTDNNKPKPTPDGGKKNKTGHKRRESMPAYTKPTGKASSAACESRQANRGKHRNKTDSGQKDPESSQWSTHQRIDQIRSQGSVHAEKPILIQDQSSSSRNAAREQNSSKSSSKNGRSIAQWDHTSFVYMPAEHVDEDLDYQTIRQSRMSSSHNKHIPRTSLSSQLHALSSAAKDRHRVSYDTETSSGSFDSLEEDMNRSISPSVESWVKNSSISGLEGYLTHHTNEFGQPYCTIFAGDGWIEPHPLSVTSGSDATPPQSVIRVPMNGGRGYTTMTYGDWQRLHDDTDQTSSIHRRGRSSPRRRSPSPIEWPDRVFLSQDVKSSNARWSRSSKVRDRTRAELEAAYQGPASSSAQKHDWSTVSLVSTNHDDQERTTWSSVSAVRSPQKNRSYSRHSREDTWSAQCRSRRMDGSDVVQLQMPWDDDW